MTCPDGSRCKNRSGRSCKKCLGLGIRKVGRFSECLEDPDEARSDERGATRQARISGCCRSTLPVCASFPITFYRHLFSNITSQNHECNRLPSRGRTAITVTAGAMGERIPERRKSLQLAGASPRAVVRFAPRLPTAPVAILPPRDPSRIAAEQPAQWATVCRPCLGRSFVRCAAQPGQVRGEDSK